MANDGCRLSMFRSKVVPLRGEPTTKTGGLLPMLALTAMRLAEALGDDARCSNRSLAGSARDIFRERHLRRYVFQFRRPDVVGGFATAAGSSNTLLTQSWWAAPSETSQDSDFSGLGAESIHPNVSIATTFSYASISTNETVGGSPSR